MNTNIPHFYAYARSEFFYNLEKHRGEFTKVMVFGIASPSGRALGFHVMTEEGAVYWRVPIHALCQRPVSKTPTLENCQLWDCFGDKVEVTTFNALAGLRVKAFLKDGTEEFGRYMFTVDWYDNPYSDSPEQNKCAHFLALEDGNYAALPNNRILWNDASWVETPFEKKPEYLVNTHAWKCES